MIKVQLKMNSKIGNLYLVASENGLHAVSWEDLGFPTASSKNQVVAEILNETKKQMTEYLDGHRKNFDLPLAAEGTAFQKQVWNQLRKIPYGKTSSYKDIAIKVKNPQACRAVGGANGKNPLLIVVPCHRVIAANGSLGGFSGDIKIKEHLLRLESQGILS